MDRDHDLGALFARVTRRLIDAERPLLEADALSMWQYVILTELGERSAPSQQELARRIRYDKTRLIALIDELSDRALIRRTPDPADRRAHTIALTDEGAAVLARTRARVRVMEDELLAPFTGEQRRTLREMVARLADDQPERD
jgi:DNA-binding MarR family transcriptional regulator